MKTKLITFLLVLCAVTQAAVLVGRRGSDGNSSTRSLFLLGDTLVRLEGLAVDGSEDSLEVPFPAGVATVVYAFSSECVHCDKVAPLKFQGHGSALARIDSLAVRLAHSHDFARNATSNEGGSS